MGVWFSTAQSTRLPAHEHQAWELNLMVAGSLSYELDEGEAQVSAGEWIWIPPGRQHRLSRISEDASLWVAEIRPDALTGSALLEERLDCTRPSDADREAASRLLHKLWLRPAKAVASKLETQLCTHLSAAQQRASSQETQAPPPQHEAVVRARRVCESLGSDELDMPTLAKEAALSPSRLSHLFKAEVGLTPLQYRNFCRVQAFIAEYQGGERNLTRAALRSGFGSYPQFHRVFRQVCGLPPRSHLDWLLEVDERP